MVKILTLLICFAIVTLARTGDVILSGHEIGTAKEESSAVTACAICKGLAFLLDNSVKNGISQVEAKEMLAEECKKSGIYDGMCTTFVSDYFMDMWVLLQMELEPDSVCSKLGLCSSTASVKIDFCPICESILPQVQVIVDKASTEVEVCTLMEMFCQILPYDPAVFAACNSDIQTKLPKLWATLKDCVDNATACCIKLKVCKAPSHNILDFIEDTSHNILDFMEDTLSSVQAEANTTCPPLNCTTCESALAQLQFIVDNNSTEQDVVELLQLACGELPPYYQSKCNDFLQNNFSVYWSKLKKCLDNPQYCCALLGVCNKSALGIEFLAERLSSERAQMTTKPQVKCMTCENILITMEKIVDPITAEDEAITLMEILCQMLPEDAQTQCSCLIKIDLIHARNIFRECLSSKECCTLFGACSASALKTEWLSKILESHGCMEKP